MITRLSLFHTPIPALVQHCEEILRGGGILCVPTDTVYGLVVLFRRRDSVDRLYEIKGRPHEKPFALFTDGWKRIQHLPIENCPAGKRLADVFWPGALTLVLPLREEMAGMQQNKIGVRCPDVEWILQLVHGCDDFLVNTSFNRSGEESARSLEGMEELLDQVDLVVDGGVLEPSLPSTVVDCSVNPPRLLREGALPWEKIVQIKADR